MAECRERLRKKEYDTQEAEDALSWAASRGYLNDRTYAQRFLEGPARRRAYSTAQVHMKLLRLGIDRSIIRETLTGQQDHEAAAALRILGRRRKNLGDPDLRRKAIAGLRRRGFSSETVRAALTQIGSFSDEVD